MAQKNKMLQEAARAVTIAAHSAAGLCTTAKAMDAARLLRIAESMARAAMTQLVPEQTLHKTEGQWAQHSHVAADATPPAKPSGRRRKRKSKKKKTAGGMEVEQQQQGAAAEAAQFVHPPATPPVANLPSHLNLFTIIDAGPVAANDFVRGELRRRGHDLDESIVIQMTQFLTSMREASRNREGYDGTIFRMDCEAMFDKLPQRKATARQVRKRMPKA